MVFRIQFGVHPLRNRPEADVAIVVGDEPGAFSSVLVGRRHLGVRGESRTNRQDKKQILFHFCFVKLKLLLLINTLISIQTD